MLKNASTIRWTKIICGSLGAVAIGAGIGLGYHYSNSSNPYSEYFRRPTNYGDSALELSYQAAVRNGADVLIGAGFTQNAIISHINTSPIFNQTGFLGIDVSFSGQDGWNVSTINFRTEQSGFLAALAGAEYLNQNQDFFLKDANDVLSYCAWGGMGGQSVDSYLSGFQQGMLYFNNQILPKLNGKMTHQNHPYQPIYLAFQKNLYAGGFGVGDGDSIIGDIIASQCTLMNDDGTIVKDEEGNPKKVQPKLVFPVAGPQTATLVQRIVSDHLKIGVVGVDTGMENDPMTTANFNLKTNTYPTLNGQECKSIIPFSAIKDMEATTATVLTNILNGVNAQVAPDQGGNGMGGLGWYSVGNIANNGTGISDAGHQTLINLMQTAGLLTGTNNSYQSVKTYFSTTYDLNQKLTCNVIDGANSHKTYVQLRDPGWLISKTETETEQEYQQREANFIEQCHKFGQAMSQKLKALETKPNKSDFQNSIKLILSTPNSVLFDHSFSESAYLGLCRFYQEQNCPIPNGSK